MAEDKSDYNSKYSNWTKRLEFDKSLYPPESEWKDPWGPWWEYKEFVGYHEYGMHGSWI